MGTFFSAECATEREGAQNSVFQDFSQWHRRIKCRFGTQVRKGFELSLFTSSG